MAVNQGPWHLYITPKRRVLDLPLKEVFAYRDLLLMLVRRNFAAQYKQTVLGPAWLLLQPALTTGVFMVIFSEVAELPTDELPPSIFYLSGLVCWTFFSSTLMTTARTFRDDIDLYSKVYFPRLIVPLSITCSQFVALIIQFLLLAIYSLYISSKRSLIDLGVTTLLIPLVVLIIATTALGIGLIAASTTAKYRDLAHLIGFGVQLLMYATPVIYPVSTVPDRYVLIPQLNPMAHLIEAFRFGLFGAGQFSAMGLIYAAGASATLSMAGVLSFNQVERRFVDTI